MGKSEHIACRCLVRCRRFVRGPGPSAVPWLRMLSLNTRQSALGVRPSARARRPDGAESVLGFREAADCRPPGVRRV